MLSHTIEMFKLNFYRIDFVVDLCTTKLTEVILFMGTFWKTNMIPMKKY